MTTAKAARKKQGARASVEHTLSHEAMHEVSHEDDTAEPIVDAFESLVLSRRSRIAVSLAFVLVIVSVGMLLLDQLYKPSAFPVKAVHYTGTFKHVTAKDLEKVVNPIVDGNLFALDLERVKQAAESLPWVERAHVRRRWPGVVSVDVDEQQLVARWLPGGYINQHGSVVSLPQTIYTRALPELSGPVSVHATRRDTASSERVLDRYRRWGSLLVASGLKLQRLTVDDHDIWKASVQLNNQPGGQASAVKHTMDIIIGRQDAEYRLARFARMFRQALHHRFSEVGQIDLRYPNGFAVEWQTDSSQTRTAQTLSEGATRA